MSLLVTVVVNNGIVMAADSRTTWTHKDGTITYQDGTHKLFQYNNKIAVSSCRNASINRQTIEFHFNKIKEKYPDLTIHKLPKQLKDYFLSLKSDCNIAFFVVGYDNNDKPVGYRVYTQEKNERLSVSYPTSYWLGDRNFASRAFGKVYVKDGSKYIEHEDYKLRLDKYSLIDAVKYATFMIEASSKYQEFFDVKKTIGGPIDILIIQKSGSYWYSKH